MTYRNIRSLLLACLFGFIAVACGEKKGGNQEIIRSDYEVPEPQAPITMSQSDVESDVEWVEGRTYRVLVSRTPADSLSMVTDNMGQQFVDNRVEITVKRQDGTTFYNHVFTKSSFASWLDGDYRSNALLEGINFVKAEENRLVFNATVNHPRASDDEAIYLELSVSRLGEAEIHVNDENLREDLTLQDNS
ncbi:MAG: DUF4738 domain-containing protein [Prevotella sp.]|nr:DUF4738 domain-containing protein [Prevotella sp.]